MDWRTLLGFTVIFHALVYLWRREWILRLDTRRFNQSINKLGYSRMRKYIRIWFRLGTYVTIILGFPFTLWLFLRTIFYTLVPPLGAILVAVTESSSILSSSTELELHHEPQGPFPDAAQILTSSNSNSNSYLAIQPILPGWNLPLSQLPYYLLAILIAVLVHELGHGFASAAHHIPILSMGISLFGPLIPTAHVELNSLQLRETGLKKQLDILTAGVWMNIYLSLICYFVVPPLLPALLWPTHTFGLGISATGIVKSTGVGGPGGLERGDVIIGIENCPIEDADGWFECIEKVWRAPPAGFCLQKSIVAKMSNNSEGCCGSDNSPTHLCFKEVGIHAQFKDDNALVDGDALQSSNNHSNASSACLPAIPTLTTGGVKCYSPNYACPVLQSAPKASEVEEKVEKVQEIEEKVEKDEGIEEKVPKDDEIVDDGINCYLPRIVQEFKRFRIIQIHRRQEDVKESVLFVGDVFDLINGVRISEFVPRNWWLSKLLGFSFFCLIPVELETVLLLTAGLSAGLAIVNILPIYMLDGYHVVDSIVRESLGKTWEPSKTSKLVKFISLGGVILVLLTLLCSAIQNF